VNGKLVANPIVSLNQWYSIGIRFTQLIDFANAAGYFRVKHPALVNNISFYQATPNQILEIVQQSTWYNLEYPSNVGTTWGTVDNNAWSTYLTTGATETIIITASPSDIYKSFVGTNKIIFEANESNQLKLGNYQYASYVDTFSTIKTLSAT
jgi:hypothetical protein